METGSRRYRYCPVTADKLNGEIRSTAGVPMHRRAVSTTVRRNRLHPWRIRQHAECCAQNEFCVLVTPVGVRTHLIERSTRLSLAKAEGAQRAKRLSVCFGNVRIHDSPVSSAVRVARVAGATQHVSSHEKKRRIIIYRTAELDADCDEERTSRGASRRNLGSER